MLATSSPADQAELDNGVQALHRLGLQPEVLASARAVTDHLGTNYLAGEDAQRADDLTSALAGRQYHAMFCGRGGYGAQRTLELLDWTAIDPNFPRVIVGYSDVTALLEAVLARLGWSSLFGPVVAGPDFRVGSAPFQALAKMLFEPAAVTELRFNQSRTLVAGAATGISLGGTLSLLASSLGTPTSVPAHGAILLIEDVGEQPYQLDRMLTQLRRSGYLDGVRGVLAGSFSRCGTPEIIDRLLLDRLGDLGVPVLAGADLGHGVPQQTYPIGVRVELDADARVLRLCEPALVRPLTVA